MAELKPVGIYREMYKKGPAGLPSINAAWDPRMFEERHAILEYMRKAEPVFDVMEATGDLISGEGWIPGGSSLISDGEWIWREDSVHHLARYPLVIPAEFVERVRARGFLPLKFDLNDDAFHDAVLRYF